MVKEGQLRVWHIPQLPKPTFKVEVKSLQEAKKILQVLALYDLFQFHNKIKPDYSNAQGLEIYENKEWIEWMDEEGNDIDGTDKV